MTPPSIISRTALATLAILLVGSGCGVQFQQTALYSGIEAEPVPERPRLLRLAAEPIIFGDSFEGDDTLWFEEEMGCTEGGLTREAVAEGDNAVRVTWTRDQGGCEWAGMGFGWDGWAGKDLSSLLPYAAIQMKVRSQTGRMYGLPIVMTLEDYSGGLGFAYTGNKYFERSFIDEEWQSVTVPLNAFDLEKENLDITNVKQLMFELQQSGSIFVDDIRLVFFEEEEQEPWIILPERPSPTALPITLFDEEFINDDGWGLIDDACQSIQRTEDPAASGQTALRLEWDVTPEQCYEGSMGVSWDQWYPIDVTPIADEAAIQFEVRLSEGTATQVPVRVALEDYNRRVSQIILNARYTPSGSFTTEWQTVTIPFSELRGGGRELAAAPATVGNLPEFADGADLSNIKHLVFFLDEAGEVLIDDIRLVSAQ